MLGKAVSPAIQDMSGLVHQCEICFYWSGIHLFHQIGSAGAWRSCVWLTHGAPLYKECFQTTYLCFNEGERKDVVFSVFPCFTLLVKRKKSHFVKSANSFPLNCKERRYRIRRIPCPTNQVQILCLFSVRLISLIHEEGESSTFREVPASTC